MPATIEQPAITLASIAAHRRRKGVIFVVSAFGDESSDETHQRVFAVGAVFGEQHQWDDLEIKWRERIGDKDFHATECDSDQGDYADRPHPENKELYKDLTQLLAQSGLLGYGVAIDLISQNEHMKGLLPESPYYKCFGEVVIFFAHRTSMFVPRQQVKFTFDRRLEIQYNATALYDYMAHLPEWDDRPYLHDEVSFASGHSVGVQAADLFTREIMKHLDNEVGPVKRKPRKSLLALQETERFGGTLYTGEYFKGLQQAITRLDEQGVSGAFKPGHYTEWKLKNKLQDTYSTRLRYLSQHDAIQRASGNPTHFDDVRQWATKYEANKSDRDD